MAARVYAAALGLASFCKQVIIYMLFLSLFVKNIRSKTSYTRQNLREIGLHIGSVDFTVHLYPAFSLLMCGLSFPKWPTYGYG